jgi:hypothetical protein
MERELTLEELVRAAKAMRDHFGAGDATYVEHCVNGALQLRKIQ